MTSLPLTQKLPENNLFKMLNLPLSSKWPQVKKAYEMRLQELELQKKHSTPGKDKARLEQEEAGLKQAYTAFSTRISEKNADLYQTREALKTLNLPDSSDWDKVHERFGALKQQGDAPQYAAAYQQLENNRTLLTKDKRTGKTWIAAAAILGTAGISLAAYHTLNAEEAAEIMRTSQPVTNQVSDPEDPASEANSSSLDPTQHQSEALGLDALDEENLNQYIDDNFSIDQEILSMVGMVPDQVLSLTLERKVDVLLSMARSI